MSIGAHPAIALATALRYGYLAVVLTLALLSPACQPDPVEEVVPLGERPVFSSEPVRADFFGTLVDEDGRPVAGATVTAGDRSTTTAADGGYVLSDATVARERAVVTFSAESYLRNRRMLIVAPGGSYRADGRLLRLGSAEAVAADAGGTVAIGEAGAAFNEGAGPRVALHSLDLAHASAAEYEDHFLPFARLHIPATRTPPWPYPVTEQAFAVDAGAHQRLRGLRGRLEGLATYDGRDLSVGGEVTWEVIDGPGAVDFAQSRAIGTDVAFGRPGVYRLRLRIRSAHPTDARKYYLLTDDIRVEAGASGPLPATLTHFGASLSPLPTTLTWQTATEQDVRHFEVERSGRGGEWASIGTVFAAGDSATPRDYRFWDATPPTGLSYYRLVTVDEDGTRDESAVVSVTVEEGEGLVLAPNPAASTVCVSGASQGTRLRIVDQLGRVVLARTLASPCVDVTDLSSGLYVVTAGDRTARLVVE